MSNSSQRFIAIGASFAALSVIAGAFGAHAVRGLLSSTSLDTYHTAVDYMFMHAIAIIFIGLLNHQRAKSCHKNIVWLFIIGIMVFSGSLFALSLSEMKWLGAITPFGGMCFIIAWLWLAGSYFKNVD